MLKIDYKSADLREAVEAARSRYRAADNEYKAVLEVWREAHEILSEVAAEHDDLREKIVRFEALEDSDTPADEVERWFIREKVVGTRRRAYALKEREARERRDSLSRDRGYVREGLERTLLRQFDADARQLRGELRNYAGEVVKS